MKQCWNEFRSAIAAEFAAHPEDFLRQPMITRTLAPASESLSRSYAASLRLTDVGMDLLWRARDVAYGAPRVDEDSGCSMVALQHAWQLEQLWQELGVQARRVSTITEIGGGYGDMCRQIRANGFRGSYRIFDFPELAQIQHAYLQACSSPAELHPWTSISSMHALEAESLLIATFSISEMPIEHRALIEPALMGHHYLMLSWNSTFAEVDNHQWFEALGERLAPHFDITLRTDPYMRGWYLFGRKR